MNKRQLQKFTDHLGLLKEELSAQHEVGSGAANTVLLDQTKVGRLSRMDALQQQNMAKSTLQNIVTRLKLVNAALEKIDSEEYGYCEDCGEDIELQRLEVQPEASCCFACQCKQEYHPPI